MNLHINLKLNSLKLIMVFFCGRSVGEVSHDQKMYIMKLKDKYFNIFRDTETKCIETNLPTDRLLTVKLAPSYYIFLTKYNDIPITFIINFELEQFFTTRFRFDKLLYNNTVLTGEFFRNDKCTWSFYIEDIHWNSGTKVSGTLPDRIESIYQILKNMYKWDEYINICHLELKPYFLFDQMNKNTFTVNELILLPDILGQPILKYRIENKVICQQDNTNNTNTTINASIIPILDQIDGYHVINKTTNENIGLLLVNSAQDSNYLRNFFKTKKFMVARCTYNPHFKKWQRVQGGKF